MLKVNFINKTKKDGIYAVVDGLSIPLESVKDDIFSKKMLGDGIAIEPFSNMIFSPCDGTLTTIFPTGHAFGITRDDGTEILVHIGIDSVTTKGKGFKIIGKVNSKVKKGDRIVEANFKYLRSLNIDVTIMIILVKLNGQNFKPYFGNVKAKKDLVLEKT